MCKYHSDLRSIFNFILRISHYATVATSDSVLIIGGQTHGSPSYTSTIAEYKDGSWSIFGNLAQSRYHLGAITSRSDLMVFGGRPGDHSTELWDLNSREFQIIDPTDQYTSPAMFLVDEGFCSKN